eukprot:m.8301 g.8301  ORF g.8301 m.8301 type:complete len:226 (+) comp20483_c0_seq2:62-739(+)
MGRVGRHKRIKAFDPFSKRRVDTSRRKNVDLPPPDDSDSESPQNARKQKRKRKKGLESLCGSMFLKDAMKIPLPESVEGSHLEDDFRLDGESHGSPVKKGGFKQKKGENVEAYFDRVNKETTRKLKSQFQLKNSTSQKRKKIMQGRAEKKRKKAVEKKEEHDRSDFKKDDVRFGEVVHAPPALAARPMKKRIDCQKQGDIVKLEKERQRVVLAYRLNKQRKMLKH